MTPNFNTSPFVRRRNPKNVCSGGLGRSGFGDAGLSDPDSGDSTDATIRRLTVTVVDSEEVDDDDDGWKRGFLHTLKSDADVERMDERTGTPLTKAKVIAMMMAARRLKRVTDCETGKVEDKGEEEEEYQLLV